MDDSALSVVQVALFGPFHHCFDYLLPLHIAKEKVSPGMRVEVPFGKQATRQGVVIDVQTHSEVPKEKLKPIAQLLDTTVLLPTSIQTLIDFVSRYYCAPLGEIYQYAFPPALRKKNTQCLPPQPKETTLAFEQAKNLMTLNREQQIATDTITAHFDTFQPFLLEGITGSGKTLVYQHLIANTLAKNKQVLLLVPEIGLTPQLLSRMETVFACPIALLHSGLSEKIRLSHWMNAMQGQAKIVIGTRLATFVPLKNPGLFIIDEAHDQSFKQQSGVLFNAKDMLIQRAQLESCPIVLGTATPSLEMYHCVEHKGWQSLQLTHRAGKAKSVTPKLLDIRHKQLKEGLSFRLLDHIKKHLAQKGQVLLFINRRGYSPVYICYECGWVAECKKCDAKLTFHKKRNTLRCHHCLATYAVPNPCPTCQTGEPQPLGFGTQRLEEALKAFFPEVNIARIDRDALNTKKKMDAFFEQMQQESIDILIGTQMIAKGHHFPRLTLVGILDSDNALFSSDFRAIERMGQLITQVAGRAGRGMQSGEVFIQTFHPDHPLLKQLIHEGYRPFANALLAERKDMQLPPFSHQVLVRAESKTPHASLQILQHLKNQVLSNPTAPKKVQAFGPVPSPMEKKAGTFRHQLLLQSPSRVSLQADLKSLLTTIQHLPTAKRVRWSFDVDPQEMM